MADKVKVHNVHSVAQHFHCLKTGKRLTVLPGINHVDADLYAKFEKKLQTNPHCQQLQPLNDVPVKAVVSPVPASKAEEKPVAPPVKTPVPPAPKGGAKPKAGEKPVEKAEEKAEESEKLNEVVPDSKDAADKLDESEKK
jgi:hypothetical protein